MNTMDQTSRKASIASPISPLSDNVFNGSLPTLVAKALRDARLVADWDLVESVYRQCTEIARDEDGSYLPDPLAGYLAEALWRISANYNRHEELFISHALAVLGNIESKESLTGKLFGELYSDVRYQRFWRYAPKTVTGKRRRPTPFESLVETARRLRDANSLQDVLAGTATSGILGGSTSYGRFFNVCAQHDDTAASDLDFMIVLPDFAELPDTAREVGKLCAASSASVAALAERATIFIERGFDDDHTIFSHKLPLWQEREDPVMAWARLPGSYLLSLHFLSQPVLDYLLVADATRLNSDQAGWKRSVNDYREHAVVRMDHLRSFSGRHQPQPLPARDVDGGFLRRSRVYSFDANDQYYPGMFQNLFLPRFDWRWDNLNVARQLDAFKWKIAARFRYERRMRPHEYLRVSLAHNRAEVFAPHVIEMIDTQF
jgi:hypothetical protein